MLAGPFLALLTVIGAIILAFAIVCGVVALAASPYLLIRRLRRRPAREPRLAFEQVTA